MTEGRRNRTCDAPPEDSCVHARQAAEEAVKKTLNVTLGIDVNKPESVEAFRDELRFNRRLKKFADRGSLAFVCAIAAALAGALWVGLVSKIKGG